MRTPFWIKGNGDLVLFDETGCLIDYDVLGFWSPDCHPQYITETTDRRTVVGISKKKKSKNQIFSILELGSEGEKTLALKPGKDTEEYLGAAFDEEYDLLVLPVNQYENSSRVFPTPKTFLKLAIISNMNVSFISKQALPQAEKQSELGPKITAFSKLNGFNHFCLSAGNLITCVSLKKKQFSITRRIYGCAGLDTCNLIFLKKKILSVSKNFDGLKMVNFQGEITEDAGEDIKLVDEHSKTSDDELHRPKVENCTKDGIFGISHF